MTKPCALYEITVNGVVVYVGATTRPKQRLMEHKARKKVPRRAVLRIVSWHADVKEARAQEAARIHALKPARNKTNKFTLQEQQERWADELGMRRFQEIRREGQRFLRRMNAKLKDAEQRHG